jgi:hypothetical protein
LIRALFFAIAVVLVVSTLPIRSSQPSAFADPAFSRYYARSSPDEQQRLWGGGPLVSLVEPFTGAPGNRRLVQYFERGRMEIADDGTASNMNAISQGLLVREMATGNVQVGYDDFVQDNPASIALFGSADGADLTYADFAEAVTHQPGDRTGELLDEWIAPGGAISSETPPAEIRAGGFEPVTGHNVPDVTASWIRTDPFGIDASTALGLPISEPYWTQTGKGSAGISLVQLFERRAVVYTPDLPMGERFSLTSAGRHYYRWRYGNDPGAEPAAAEQRQVLPVQDVAASLSLPDGFRATVVADADDAFDIAVTPDGRLAIGYESRIELLDPRTPDSERTTLVDHLANPTSFTWAGTDLYVVDDSGITRHQDIDADGVADQSEQVAEAGFERGSVQIAPGPEAGLFVTGNPAPDTWSTRLTVGGPELFRIAPEDTGSDSVESTSLASERVISLVIDHAGVVWMIDSDGQLTRLQPDTAIERTLLDASQFTLVQDLILYRPDGTSGDPYRDMIALADGRIVRLQPSRPVENGASASPSTSTGPSAIVDFITGFGRPTAMAAGLDGSLYVLDTGRDVIYRITPE